MKTPNENARLENARVRGRGINNRARLEIARGPNGTPYDKRKCMSAPIK